MSAPPTARRARSDRGSVLPFVALLLPVLVLMTAFAVDLGRQRAERRTMQAVADVVALDMARLADGRTIGAIQAGDATHDSELVALAASAARNGVDVAILDLEWGTFSGGTFTPLLGSGDVPDTARVTASKGVDFFFRSSSASVARSALAQQGATDLAGFRVGSFGITLEEAGFLNQVLTPLLGNPVGLDVLGYQGLANADIGLGALGAELGLLTPEQVLTTEVPFDDVLLAAANVLERGGDVANAALLRNAINAQIESMAVTLGDLVAVDNASADSGLAGDVNVLELIKSTAFLAQCTPDPAGFADCSGLAIPTITTTLPGLTASGSLKVIQGPQYAYGPVGTSVDTGQVQLNLTTTIGAQYVGTCVPTLFNLLCLLNGLLVGIVDAAVTVDTTLTVAGGTNTIADIDCSNLPTRGLTIASDTDLYSLATTVTVNFGRRGVVGGLLGPLLGSLVLTGSTNSAGVVDAATFTVPPDVLGVTERQTGSGSIGLAPLTLSAAGTGILGTLGNLGINQTVNLVLTNLVNPLLSVLDTQVLGPLTDLLGLNVVGSDLRAERIDCGYGGIALVG